MTHDEWKIEEAINTLLHYDVDPHIYASAYAKLKTEYVGFTGIDRISQKYQKYSIKIDDLEMSSDEFPGVKLNLF